MDAKEFKVKMLGKKPEEVVDILIKQLIENHTLKTKIKQIEEEYMNEIIKYQKQIQKTAKINEYWRKTERPLRRDDFDNEEVIRRYLNGESAYRISKDLGVGQMTIISRLKRAGIYRGKSQENKG